MSHKRYANKVDANQAKIVKELRDIPGCTVEPDHDDIIVGYKGFTYWFEIKDPKRTITKDGKVYDTHIKENQKRLLNEFSGHYNIAWSTDDILHELGIKQSKKKLCGLCWLHSEINSPICKCEN